MIVKLLTEHHLELLRLKEGCRGTSVSTLVKMSNCWKSHIMAPMCTISKFVLLINNNGQRPLIKTCSDFPFNLSSDYMYSISENKGDGNIESKCTVIQALIKPCNLPQT